MQTAVIPNQTKSPVINFFFDNLCSPPDIRLISPKIKTSEQKIIEMQIAIKVTAPTSVVKNKISDNVINTIANFIMMRIVSLFIAYQSLI